ncbi:hypothetical protein BURPS1106B_2318 [Burkholderia pseudomallei 1106b]|uniref:Uncharacterized protein n=1 Tax=Burkholderia pseudomallei (strain 1106a) TaxID=357348 RepID=A3P976_BURP0|nr:hypothetical protein BURPS1106A_A2857 [Burkholderia pseudomallei 1106a]EEP51042.1 conserved hypothetical protein [Burkholderia pseudomallei MSHR346]EES23266.1 hypothetical protein BURPS1106B_2318 [Burkholderia pseudomallei 1106b]
MAYAWARIDRFFARPVGPYDEGLSIAFYFRSCQSAVRFRSIPIY